MVDKIVKRTCFKTSKMLWDIGFFNKVKSQEKVFGQDNLNNTIFIPSYDLETLLDHMPLFVEISGHFKGGIKFKAYGMEICQTGAANETLADVAARMLYAMRERETK